MVKSPSEGTYKRIDNSNLVTLKSSSISREVLSSWLSKSTIGLWWRSVAFWQSGFIFSSCFARVSQLTHTNAYTLVCYDVYFRTLYPQTRNLQSLLMLIELVDNITMCTIKLDKGSAFIQSGWLALLPTSSTSIRRFKLQTSSNIPDFFRLNSGLSRSHLERTLGYRSMDAASIATFPEYRLPWSHIRSITSARSRHHHGPHTLKAIWVMRRCARR